MRSISYYLSKPFKDGITKADIKFQKKNGKPILKPLNEKPTTIYLFLTFPGRKLIRANAMEKIKAIYWDFDTQRAKPNMHGSLELNDRLQFFKAEVTRQYREALSKNPRISLSQIKELVENVISNNVPNFNRKPLLIHLNEFIDERRATLSPLTTVKFENFVNILKQWMKLADVNENDFFFDDVNADFEYSFKEFLIHQRDLVNNTISKHLECIKGFMKWARRKGYHDLRTYEDFTIKRTRRNLIWLTQDEVNLIKEYQPEDMQLKRVKLSFLFMIYCGQRYSDIHNLKRRDLMVNSDGSVDWHLYQMKGSKTHKVIIPLLPAAIELLDKIKFREMLPDDYVIPIASNQYANHLIKDLCKAAKIDTPITLVRVVGSRRTERSVPKYKLISCHATRRTFVSLSLEKGLNPEYITSITGHTSLKTMRLYLGVSQEAKRNALIKAWEGSS
jgi:site-specific recombinase XerD